MYRTDQWCYVREPLEAFADPAVREITLCWSAQSTKTTTAAVMLLYSIDNDPGNSLFVRPSLGVARTFSEGKLIPLITGNKALSKHITGDRYDLKKTELSLDNMTIFIRGANPNQLAAESCKNVFLDETDKFEEYNEEKREADLVSLAFERMKFFRNSKGVLTSTPSLIGGIIWQHYLAGDQRFFMVPCVECGASFRMEWKFIKWPSGATQDQIRKEVVIECPHCSKAIRENKKNEMLLAGKWEPQNPSARMEKRSYHLSELYTTTKWGDLALKFIQANEHAKVGFLGPLHNFINSSLAEPWDPTERQKRDDATIRALCDNRKRFEIPLDGVLGITAGVDTQDLGFWYVVRAWGKDLESWLITEGYADDLDTVRRLIAEGDYRDTKGQKYGVNLALIDSGGHRTDEVYDFCRRNPRFRPSKGMQRTAKNWTISKIDKYANGKDMPRGLKLIIVSTNHYKDTVLTKLQLEQGARGSFHLHSDPINDYFGHMAAEYRDERGVWKCPSGKRNDLWDCEVLALCAADMLGIRYWSKSRVMIRADKSESENEKDPGEATQSISARATERKETPANATPARGNPYIRRF